MLSRNEVISTLGGNAGKKALNKVERARPTPTGRKFADDGVEYSATGTVKNHLKEMKCLSVIYSIHLNEMPDQGIFKVRPPCLVPIGYLIGAPF